MQAVPEFKTNLTFLFRCDLKCFKSIVMLIKFLVLRLIFRSNNVCLSKDLLVQSLPDMSTEQFPRNTCLYSRKDVDNSESSGTI